MTSEAIGSTAATTMDWTILKILKDVKKLFLLNFLSLNFFIDLKISHFTYKNIEFIKNETKHSELAQKSSSYLNSMHHKLSSV